MVNAQEYLNQNYLDKQIKELDLSKQNLKGSLIIQDWPNLENIKCGNNNNLVSIKIINLPKLNYFHANGCQITDITIANCPNITELNIANNLLTSTDFLANLNPAILTHLSIHSNNFSEQDLFFLSKFTSLEKLFVDNHSKEKLNKSIYNRFTGSLQPLQNLTNLKWINIANTDIDSGLEYLPESLRKICLINSWERKNAGYLKVKWEMERSLRFPKVTEKLQQEEENEPIFVKHWYRIDPWREAQKLLGEEKFKEQLSLKDAQDWLNEKYPSHTNRQYFREIVVSDKNLVEKLDLSAFIGLEKLDCSYNHLTNLDLSNCQSLTELNCANNEFTDTDFLRTIPNKEKLKILSLGENQFKETLDFLAPFTELNKLIISNNDFYGSLKPLENTKELKMIDINHTNIDSGLEYLTDNCHELYCDTNTRNKSGKITSILIKHRERKDNKEYYNLVKWREELRNNIILSIPTERLFVIRSNIKKFISKWGKIDESKVSWYEKPNKLNELSKLQSPEEFDSYKYLSIPQWGSKVAAGVGGILALNDQAMLGGGIAAISPVIDVITTKIKESYYDAKEKKWKEFLQDAEDFLDNYHELLGILKQIEFSGKLGEVNAALDNLKNKVNDFFEEYDENKDEEIDINELTKAKEKRDKLAQATNKKGKLWEIVTLLKELEKEISNYRRGFYYGKSEENKEVVKTQNQSEVVDNLAIVETNEQHAVIEVMPTPSSSSKV